MAAAGGSGEGERERWRWAGISRILRRYDFDNDDDSPPYLKCTPQVALRFSLTFFSLFYSSTASYSSKILHNHLFALYLLISVFLN